MKDSILEKFIAILKQPTKNCVERLEQDFYKQPDLKTRRFCPPLSKNTWIAIYLESMAGEQLIEESVIKPIIETKIQLKIDDLQNLCTNATTQKLTSYQQMVDKLLNGHCLIFDEKDKNLCVAFDTRYVTLRAITEPPTGNVSKGPREGFIEDAKTNLSLLKKRIKNPNFVAHEAIIGKYTNTLVLVSE